ncbi:sister chromatid cohesion protein solo [Drosophila kikkawai]|uniref:Sister chromatid cohesion protein solo n=1 Tax=Drosophila kikkawai TaxID=30033 RepID=A0ABM4GA06_DROKI
MIKWKTPLRFNTQYFNLLKALLLIFCFSAVFFHFAIVRADLNLATELPPIPPIGCSEDVLNDFIDRLELDKNNTTLDEVRELRDYLFTAFKDLVISQWANIESLDQEERDRKVQKMRTMAAQMDSLIMDVSRLLDETELGTSQEHDAFVQLKQMGIHWEENGPNLDTRETVLPQTTRSRKSRHAKKTVGRALHEVMSITDIYENGRRLDEEPQSEDAASTSQESYTEVPASETPQTYGSSRFSQNVSGGLLNCHKMKEVKYVDILQLSRSVPWPIAPPFVWPVYPKSYYRIHAFTERPMKRTREPPQTGNRGPNNTNSIQASRQIDVARHHRSHNQDLETPDGAYFSRYGATRDEEAAWSAAGVVAAEPASWSTPIKRHSELGLSLPSKLNLSMFFDEELTTPAGAPPMPPEFPLGSVADSGAVTMMTCDNEETAIVGPAAPSISEVTSGRPGGGTPASTPLHSFRPLLPVINEEHQPRMLELTINSPTSGGATLAEPPAIPSSSGRQGRDWNSIFRPRDEIINYSEGSAMPRRAVQRPRRRRRVRIPARDANNVETPQDRIQGEEQVVATISSQEITQNFMAQLLQKATEAVGSSQQTINALRLATSASANPTTSGKNPVLDQMEPREIEKNNETAEPSVSRSQISDELIFQQPRCHLEDTTIANATKEVPQQPSLELETFAVPPGLSHTISQEKIAELDTTIDISNISALNLEPPCFPTIEPMEIDHPAAQGDPSIISLANLSLPKDTSITSSADVGAHAIVTDVQILRGPKAMATSSRHLPDDTSNLTIRVVDPSAIGSNGGVASELVELENSRAESSLYNRESVEDLNYIVQHVDMLRLNIDRQKELSLTTECPESPSKRSMPAVKVYDHKIFLNIPEAKIRILHKILGAIVMHPQVDMRSADFVGNRMDVSVTFRVLHDLKAANIVNLSNDDRIFSLK